MCERFIYLLAALATVGMFVIDLLRTLKRYVASKRTDDVREKESRL